MNELLKVKSLMSISAMVVFVALALTNRMDSKDVMVIILMVFTAYFSYQGSKGGSGQ